MAKIEVNANLPVIGPVSPYSYQVAPKTWNSFGESEPRKQLTFEGELKTCRFTSGQGKAAAMRYFVYFKHAERQEWIELTPGTFDQLKKDKTVTLDLTRVKAEEPKAEEPKAPEAPTEPAAEEPKEPVTTEAAAEPVTTGKKSKR